MTLRSYSYRDHTDEALIPLVAQGITPAFDELYRRYSQKMFSYFFRMLWKNKELAEDQVQELFLKIIREAGRFDITRSFSTWLYSIAHNMCKNEYRKEEVRMKYAKTKTTDVATTEEKSVEMQQFRVAVSQCINQLTEEKKSLFILRFQEHLSVPQISTILNIPEGTIKSRLFYLLKEMKEELQEFKTLIVYP
jgi:RNA polymerase sigma-70 factor, ECF subfamily